MRELRFFAPIEPPTRTSQQKGLNKKAGRIYTKAEVTLAYGEFWRFAEDNAPAEPFTGPIEVTTRIIYAMKAKDGTDYDLLWHPQKPDVGNVTKGLTDILDALHYFLPDDRIVCREVNEKMKGREFGIEIIIRELTAPQE